MNLESKIKSLKELFSEALSKEKIYQKIIQLGHLLPAFSAVLKTEENLVKGCQSRTYLHSVFQEGTVFFTGTSDALISSGLIYILTYVFNGESPETVIQEKAFFLEEIGISSSLSLNRSNGLSQMLLHMKKRALLALTPAF